MWRLAEGGWVYSVADPSHAGHAMVTLSRGRLDLTVAKIGARGLPPRRLRPSRVLTARLLSLIPEGNVLTFVEVERSG